MKQFADVVKEINTTLNQMLLFSNVVNTTLVFLIFYLVLSLFEINALYSFIPAGLYLAYYTYLAFGKSKALLVEARYAPLREKLRTAADNAGIDNPIVEELEYEVTAEMKNVGLSMFINPKTLSYKIFAIMVLSFLVIFTSTLNIGLLQYAKNAVPDIFDRSIKGVGKLEATQLNTSEDIYGNKNVAQLGDNELNIRIKPLNFKVNVREEGDAQQEKFETVFPREMAVKETAAYEENIPVEQQELVKNYFKKLAES